VSFALDPTCGRHFPGVQIRFVVAIGLRGIRDQISAKSFDLDKISAPVVIRHDNGGLVYCGAENAHVTGDSTNVVFALARTCSSVALKQAQDDLVDLLRPHADTVIAAVIEPETPTTRLRPNEPAFML
jgi:hypothetical protein